MTLEQAKQYLNSLGLTLPDFEIEDIIEEMKSKEDCLNSNYEPYVVRRIYRYLLSIIAGMQIFRLLASGSVSGAVSQGFTYKSANDLYRGQLSMLRSLDKNGCMSDLIPDDPFKPKRAFILTVTRDCE